MMSDPQIEHAIPEPLVGERVDRVVCFLTGLSRSKVSNLIKEGKIRKNNIPVRRGAERAMEGDVLLFPNPKSMPALELKPDPDVYFEVVYEDDQLVIVDKPPGLVVHPGAGKEEGTLISGLLHRYPEMGNIGEPNRLGLVHRLDKGTSGLLLVARTEEALGDLNKQMIRREIDRTYFAIVCEHLTSKKGTIEAPLGRDPKNPIKRAVIENGKDARTHYTAIAKYEKPAKITTVQCVLETGRTHQIRVHFAAINHPVLGDSLYGGVMPADYLIRPALHAEKLEIRHPRTKEKISFSSRIPDDLNILLEQAK